MKKLKEKEAVGEEMAVHHDGGCRKVMGCTARPCLKGKDTGALGALMS